MVEPTITDLGMAVAEGIKNQGDKLNELSIKLMQATQTLAAVVEEYGTVTEDGKFLDFDADRLEEVFFDPFVAIAPVDPEKRTIRLFRPKTGTPNT